MQRRRSIAGVVLVMMGLLAGSSQAQAAGDTAASASAFLQAISSGRFSDAAKQFNATMSRSMSADQLGQTWSAIIAKCGALKATGPSRTVQEGGFAGVVTPLEFQNATIDAKIFFDGDGRIAGLWFLPHVAEPEAHYKPPSYEKTESSFESNVKVGSGEWSLPGTLSTPKGDGPFPAVVLVHGSGPNDRDESIGVNKPFRDMASGLTARGIAVLRYDKRTKVYGPKMAALKRLTVKEETIDDALAAVSLLRQTRTIDSKRIFVLGHSLGGMLIPRIGKADADIAGLIVMAGPTRSLEDCLIDQVIYLSGDDASAEAKDRIRRLKGEVARIKSPKLTADSPAVLGVPAAYWLDLRGYHPEELAKALKQPLLILQGGRDYQVTQTDYDGWSKALSGRPNVTLKLYPNLNHIFVEGEGKSTPQEYERSGSVSEAVIDDLARWIREH